MLVLTQNVAHLVKHFAINTKIKARRRFDDADIIIKTEMVTELKIDKNMNTNLNT